MSLLYYEGVQRYAVLYLLACLVCYVLVALGFGGRVLAIAAWLLVLGVVHRVPVLQGPGDILLLSLLGYLCVDTGKLKLPLVWGWEDGEERWTVNLASRAMQCHVLIWLLISFVSHLAEEMWWAGDAVWWLAAQDFTSGVTAEYLSEHVYVLNLITHGFLVIHLATILLLPFSINSDAWCRVSLVVIRPCWFFGWRLDVCFGIDWCFVGLWSFWLSINVGYKIVAHGKAAGYRLWRVSGKRAV